MKRFTLIVLSVVLLANVVNSAYYVDLKQGENRPLKIKSRPAPDHYVYGNCSPDQRRKGLLVFVSVTFHSSGKITETAIATPSGCKAYDNEVLKTAKRIKYDPELKDGTPVTVIKKVGYTFTEY